MRESELKRRVTTRLQREGWLVVHIIQCSLNGWPDTIAMKNGKIYFIEFKQPGKKPRELQEYRLKKIRNQGFETLIITDEQPVTSMGI